MSWQGCTDLNRLVGPDQEQENLRYPGPTRTKIRSVPWRYLNSCAPKKIFSSHENASFRLGQSLALTRGQVARTRLLINKLINYEISSLGTIRYDIWLVRYDIWYARPTVSINNPVLKIKIQIYPTLEVSNRVMSHRVCRLSELIKDYSMDQTCSRFWN